MEALRDEYEFRLLELYLRNEQDKDTKRKSTTMLEKKNLIDWSINVKSKCERVVRIGRGLRVSLPIILMWNKMIEILW